jgi:hypothetical protein
MNAISTVLTLWLKEVCLTLCLPLNSENSRLAGTRTHGPARGTVSTLDELHRTGDSQYHRPIAFFLVNLLATCETDMCRRPRRPGVASARGRRDCWGWG